MVKFSDANKFDEVYKILTSSERGNNSSLKEAMNLNKILLTVNCRDDAVSLRKVASCASDSGLMNCNHFPMILSNMVTSVHLFGSSRELDVNTFKGHFEKCLIKSSLNFIDLNSLLTACRLYFELSWNVEIIVASIVMKMVVKGDEEYANDIRNVIYNNGDVFDSIYERDDLSHFWDGLEYYSNYWLLP